MSQARNIYSRELDRFRRELQWVLRQYEGRPISFEIRQHLRFTAADLKHECLEAYRTLTKKICNNQESLIGSNLRIRSMANSEDIGRRSPVGRIGRFANDDGDDLYSRRSTPSIPLRKLTYDRHRAVSTNTHVLAFERQLTDDIDKMIASIETLNDSNSHTWLQIPKSDTSQYFSSRYDDCRYSSHSYNTGPFPSTSTTTK